MTKRKALSKKIRFEVFKRDKFMCQYCGRMAPDVILEVDHLHPVAEGGTDELVNLITACRDCNRGKGKRRLNDNDELKKQQKALADLAEKREQAEMMSEWRKALSDAGNEMANAAADVFQSMTGFELTRLGIQDMKKLIREFSYPEVLEAIDIAVYAYFDGSRESAAYAFKKIGGVCYNTRKQNAEQYNAGGE